MISHGEAKAIAIASSYGDGTERPSSAPRNSTITASPRKCSKNWEYPCGMNRSRSPYSLHP